VVGRLDAEAVAGLVPRRDPRGHKGTFGTLLVVSGSLDYAGAALICGAAALRAGAGLVVLCVPASLQPIVAGRVPELVTLGLPERAPGRLDPRGALAAIVERPADALVVGPGLAADPGTGTLVELLRAATRRAVRPGRPGDAVAPGGPDGPQPVVVEEDPGAGEALPPVVLDAEALNQLAARRGWWRRPGRPAILTPHPGEFARLTGRKPLTDEERLKAAREAAGRWSAVVVLKGAHTVVAAPDGRVARSTTAQPALASAGSGDVLAGVAGSLLAQGMAPYEAACLAVHLHAGAGEHLAEGIGDAGLLATDLLAEIPRLRRDLTRLRDRRAGGAVGFARPAIGTEEGPRPGR
jgi:NAD(P)H-hydrate epimerase